MNNDRVVVVCLNRGHRIRDVISFEKVLGHWRPNSVVGRKIGPGRGISGTKHDAIVEACFVETRDGEKLGKEHWSEHRQELENGGIRIGSDPERPARVKIRARCPSFGCDLDVQLKWEKLRPVLDEMVANGEPLIQLRDLAGRVRSSRGSGGKLD